MAEGTLFVGNVEVLALTDGEGEFPFTLRQFFPTVPAEDSTRVACHFPAPGFGRLVRLEGRCYWQGL